MSTPRIVPALADLTQDIAGPVPLQLLQDWAGGTQDLERAQELLEVFRIIGTVVSTDTSGLSRMTQEKDLLDVLALISRPKEIVHAIGTEIGGRAIGTWVADNTEMFYEADVRPEIILDAMHEARMRIREATPVQLGMCIHWGLFYEIGGGLYGHNADAVETLAENWTDAGQILVTGAAWAVLRERGPYVFQPREDLETHFGPVFTLEHAHRMPELHAENIAYPHSFSREFRTALSQIQEHPDREDLKSDLYRSHLRERVVVFLARELPAGENEDLVDLLDRLLMDALMQTIVSETMHARRYVAGYGGSRTILTFDTAREALDFALEIRSKFAENSLQVRIGIDSGPVLHFWNTDRPIDCAGDPVNIASKISEDAGRAGAINLTSRVRDQLTDLPESQPFALTVSNVRVSGVTL